MGPGRNDWPPDLLLIHRRLHGRRCLCRHRGHRYLIAGVFAAAVAAALPAAVEVVFAAAAARVRIRRRLRPRCGNQLS